MRKAEEKENSKAKETQGKVLYIILQISEDVALYNKIQHY